MRLIRNIFSIGIVGLLVGVYTFNRSTNYNDTFLTAKITPTVTITPTPTIIINAPSQTKIIPQQTQIFQSFNNCGPASLSMLLSYYNMNISQDIIGQQLRPYQNSQGNNDDKSVTLPELAAFAEEQNFITYHRPNGSLEIAKLLIANDIPFIVRTWLNPNEDIGHYRVVRGYDDLTQEFIQDDSYQGGNIRYSYEEFMLMWQPFNYEYLIIIPPEKEIVVKEIIKENEKWETAWQNALVKAQKEQLEEPENPYPIFNQSVAYYYLGNYDTAVETYQSVSARLPNRMLWYQIEPIKAYLEVGNYDTVFTLTNSILNNQNRAFSELYLIRGKAYEVQGNTELARQEYLQAVFYNQYLKEAENALKNLENY